MCIELAAQVISRDGDSVVVDVNGRRRNASTLFVPDVAVDDWVYIAAGTVIERLDPNEALEINELVRNAQGTLT